MASTLNNSWDANDANLLRIVPCGMIAPRTTSGDDFCERHTDVGSALPPKKSGSLSEKRYRRTVGFVQFIRVIRVRLLFRLGAIETSKPSADPSLRSG